MAFEEVQTDTWKPENPNDEIVGVLINVEKEVGENKSNLYTIENGDKYIKVWGSTVLDPNMSAVKIGEKVKIVFTGLGEAKAGRNPPKLFKVYVDRE